MLDSLFSRFLLLLAVVLLSGCTLLDGNKASSEEGVVTYYDYHGGRLLGEIPYFNGEPHGLAKLYRDDGKLEQETHFFHGQFDGQHRYWWSNGNIMIESHFRYDNYYGSYLYFNESGQLIQALNFKNNQLDGTQKHYLADGTLIRTEVYDQGEKIKETIHHPRGRQPAEETLITRTVLAPGGKQTLEYKTNEYGDGVLTRYEADGRIRSISPLLGNKINGVVKKYHKKGYLSMEEYYINGRQEGITRSYYANGNVDTESPVSGVLNGVVHSFYPDGTLKWAQRYWNHKPMTDRIYYDKQGNVIKEDKPRRFYTFP